MVGGPELNDFYYNLSGTLALHLSLINAHSDCGRSALEAAHYLLYFNFDYSITVLIPVRINAVTVIYLRIDPKWAQDTSTRGRNWRPKNTLSRAALLKHGSRRVSEKYTLDGRAFKTWVPSASN